MFTSLVFYVKIVWCKWIAFRLSLLFSVVAFVLLLLPTREWFVCGKLGEFSYKHYLAWLMLMFDAFMFHKKKFRYFMYRSDWSMFRLSPYVELFLLTCYFGYPCNSGAVPPEEKHDLLLSTPADWNMQSFIIFIRCCFYYFYNLGLKMLRIYVSTILPSLSPSD